MLLPIAIALAQTESFNTGLLKDFEVLKSAYTRLHPGLYRYNTPAQVEKHFANLRGKLEVAKNLGEAFRGISELTGAVQCGHTYPNFYNQSDDIANALFKGRTRLPFYFRWLGGKMVVIEDFSKSKLARGSEIVAIDGKSVAFILKALLPISRSDGGNDDKRVANLEVRGLDEYEAFDIYYPLYFKVGSAFKLKLIEPGGRRADRTVKALSFEERLAAHKARTKPKDNPWDVRTVRPGIKVLRTPTWVMYNTKWDWEGYLARTFEALAKDKTESLIMDLRGNEGGNSVGDVILSYLIDRPISFNDYRQFTRYRTVPPDLKPYLDTWDRSFDDWTAWTSDKPVTMGGTQLYRMSRWDDAAGSTIQPKKPRFGGKVAVLVDSSNSSASFEFARMFRIAKRGILVGEPTGGNQRGINGSAFYFLRLPNSKIEVDIPLVATISQISVPDKGLEPDLRVQTTAKDITAGRDAVLERAIKAISK